MYTINPIYQNFLSTTYFTFFSKKYFICSVFYSELNSAVRTTE